MGRPIGAHQPRAIHGEAHGQVLQGDIMHDLVEGALQEGGIDGAEGLHAVRRKARREGHRMLLGDAHIKGAVGKGGAEEIKPRARRHGGGDGDDALIPRGLLDEAFGEDLCIGGSAGLGLRLRARRRIIGADPVHAVSGGLCGRKTLALVGERVNDDGGGHIPRALERLDESIDIVSINRANIIEAHFLEPGGADPFIGALIAQAQPVEIMRHGAAGLRDGHFVVVQHHDELRAKGPRVVQGLIGHARRHRAIADHRNDVALFAQHIARHRKAERRGNGSRGMGRAEGVVFTLRALGEAGEAAALPQAAHLIAPSRKNLVGIGLVADIPDQPIMGRLEDIM